MQGDAVTYSVAPSLLFDERASLVMALASAWSTYGLDTLLSSSHMFSNPVGVPLYPSDIIILFFTTRAPTLRRMQ